MKKNKEIFMYVVVAEDNNSCMSLHTSLERAENSCLNSIRDGSRKDIIYKAIKRYTQSPPVIEKL